MNLKVERLTIGCEIKGMSILDAVSHSQSQQTIKNLLAQHKLLLFRNESILSEHEQIHISQCFGELETAGFIPHCSSASDYVLRLSNDPNHGLQNFGTGGFHIDCSFLEKPNCVSIYHMIHAPILGDTGNYWGYII